MYLENFFILLYIIKYVLRGSLSNKNIEVKNIEGKLGAIFFYAFRDPSLSKKNIEVKNIKGKLGSIFFHA